MRLFYLTCLRDKIRQTVSGKSNGYPIEVRLRGMVGPSH